MGADSGILMPSPKMDGDKKDCAVCGISFYTGYKKDTKAYAERRICKSTACRGVIAQRTRRASGIAGIAALSKENRNAIKGRVDAMKEMVGRLDGVPVFRVPRGASYEE